MDYPTKQSRSVRTCACSPTTHPGSFRCALHRGGGGGAAVAYRRRAAEAAAIEAKAKQKCRTMHALLLQIIKPSTHDVCRRRDFHPKPSRFAGAGNRGIIEVV